MPQPEPDQRSAQRKALDEQIAAEPIMPPPAVPTGAPTSPMEAQLARRHPVALQGVVENGLVRPLDPAVKLPEQSRVIIVASEPR
jgi:hypothetical protein